MFQRSGGWRYFWPNEIIFHQHGFPWKKGSHFPSQNATFYGFWVVWGCYNFTNMTCFFPVYFLDLQKLHVPGDSIHDLFIPFPLEVTNSQPLSEFGSRWLTPNVGHVFAAWARYGLQIPFFLLRIGGLAEMMLPGEKFQTYKLPNVGFMILTLQSTNKKKFK